MFLLEDFANDLNKETFDEALKEKAVKAHQVTSHIFSSIFNSLGRQRFSQKNFVHCALNPISEQAQ